MGRKYANPPIIEAVCEFRLASGTRWDLTVPGLLYEKLKGLFPQKEQRVIQEVELTQGPDGLQQQFRTSERIMFFTNDRKMLVQVGPRLLVINVLKPYPHWEGFKPCTELAWKSLQETIEVQGLERIGLRYINRIELPAQNAELSEYFEFYPFVGSRLPQHMMMSFLAAVEFSYANDRDRCRLQLTPVSRSVMEGKTAFMLDLDYFLARPLGVAVPDVLNWIEEAHSRVEEIFEGCITDNLRNVFQEVL